MLFLLISCQIHFITFSPFFPMSSLVVSFCSIFPQQEQTDFKISSIEQRKTTISYSIIDQNFSLLIHLHILFVM